MNQQVKSMNDILWSPEISKKVQKQLWLRYQGQPVFEIQIDGVEVVYESFFTQKHLIVRLNIFKVLLDPDRLSWLAANIWLKVNFEATNGFVSAFIYKGQKPQSTIRLEVKNLETEIYRVVAEILHPYAVREYGFL